MGIDQPTPAEAIPEKIRKSGEKFHESEAIEVTNDMIESVELIPTKKDRLAADIENLQAELESTRKRIDQAEMAIMKDMKTAGVQDLLLKIDMDTFVHDYYTDEIKPDDDQEIVMAAMGIKRAVEMVNLMLQDYETKRDLMLPAWKKELEGME